MSETQDLPDTGLDPVQPVDTKPPTWRRAPDLQHLGRVKDSALVSPHFLLRRSDGQVVQLSELLNTVVEEIDPDRSADEVADAVSTSYGRSLTVEGLQHLVEARLMPLGLVEDVDEPALDRLPVSTPLLSLSLRGTLVPERAVRWLAGVLRPLFWPPVVVTALLAVVVLDVALVRRGDLLVALQQLLTTPVMLLVFYVVMTASAVFHELGHATACRYGGAEPGTIGFGVYLVFPAFYTDVTDSYRLGRSGRVRTDLGGLYFNVLTLLGFGLCYLVTGQGLLLLAAFVLHIEMAQQLIPAVRFDGYYVLADTIGVPDLFARVRPTLLSLLPGHEPDQRVAELKPMARRIVAVWVLVVVPVLLVGFGWLIWNLPVLVRQTIIAAQFQIDQLAVAWASTDLIVVVLSVLSLFLLLLPLLGVAILLYRSMDSLVRVVARLLGRKTDGDGDANTMADPASRFSAAAFNDEDMLPSEPHVATMGWQQLVYRVSGHTLKPGPGSEERRRELRADQLRTPIEGTRRVVVMSRKGGVGKTTISLALGSILATQRGDRVIAVDANPDAGNLAHRVAPVNGLTITDVLRDLESIESYAALKRYTTQAPESRLEVLASDDDSRIGIALDRADYHRLIGLLDTFYNLILLDTGTGILDSANQGLIAEADELVLVLRAGLDGGRAAALTLDWLDEHDYSALVREAVVVINAVRPGVGAPIDPIREHFEHRCRRVVTIPWDPSLETGAQTMLSSLNGATEESLLEMAAAVAENFPVARAVR